MVQISRKGDPGSGVVSSEMLNSYSPYQHNEQKKDENEESGMGFQEGTS
jgi:hypothetical protein